MDFTMWAIWQDNTVMYTWILLIKIIAVTVSVCNLKHKTGLGNNFQINQPSKQAKQTDNQTDR